MNTFSIDTRQDITLDNISGYGYALTNRANYPYVPSVLVDEDFSKKAARK